MAKKKTVPKKVAKKTTKAKAKTSVASLRRRVAAVKVKLLSGENPQIAKGEGNAPVQAYIKAIPGWKKGVAKRVDEIISETLPEVQKAVKWNSPFYGIDGQGYFAGVHCFKNYIKIAFFKGVYLTPPLPGQSKQKEVRYLDLHEGELDEKLEKQLVKWVRQAAAMPGWKP